MRRLSLRALLGVLLAVLTVATAAPAAAQTADLPLLTVAAKRDPCPGAQACFDFRAGRYKAFGVVTSTLQALPGLSVSRSTGGYAETMDGRLLWFQANTARATDRGLLREETRTNSVTRSQEQNLWNTPAFLSVTADNQTAPDGSLTADQITADGTSNTHYAISPIFSVTSGQAYAFSVYAKAGPGGQYLQIGGNSTGWATNACANFDLQAGVVTSTCVGSTASISAAANGWWRLQVVSTATATTANAQVYLAPIVAAAATRNPISTASGTNFVWGAQLEQGAVATSYIPTTSTAAIRPADEITWNGLAAVLAGPFTLVETVDLPQGDGVTRYMAEAGDGTTANRVFLSRDASNNAFIFAAFAGGTAQPNALNYANRGAGARVASGALRVRAGSYTAALDGVVAAPVAITNPTGMDRVYLGGRSVGNFALNGYIRSFAIYGDTSDGQLSALTNGADASSLKLDFARGLYRTATPYVRLNKAANTNVNPLTTAGVTVSGDQNAVLSIVDDGPALAAAGLSYLGPHVYKVDCSTCAAGSNIDIAGQLGNTNNHVVSVYWRGSGSAQARTSGNGTPNTALTPNYVRHINSTNTPVAATNVTRLFASPGSVIYFVGNQTEEAPAGALASSLIPVDGAPASVATTESTNPADIGGFTFARSTGEYATTASGQLVWFEPNVPAITDAGIWFWESRTNKSTNFNVNPQTLSGVGWGGDPAAVLSLVNDSAALAEIGLTGNAFKFDNSAGTTSAWVTISGAVGNTNPHTVSSYVRGSGLVQLRIETQTVSDVALTSDYVRQANTQTPSATNKRAEIRISAGSVVYFIFNQLEEGGFASSPIPVAGASATRAADVAYYLLPSGAAPATGFTLGAQAGSTGINASGNAYPAAVSDGTANNMALLNYTSARTEANAVVGGSTLVAAAKNWTFAADVPHGMVARFQSNVIQQATDGSLAASPSNTFTLPAFTRLDLGNRPDGARPLNGALKEVDLYAYPANDNELSYRSAGNF